MDKMKFEIDGKKYAVRDSEKGYEVIFPDGSYNVLVSYLDESQETAFEFEDKADPELAKELGELIIRWTM